MTSCTVRVYFINDLAQVESKYMKVFGTVIDESLTIASLEQTSEATIAMPSNALSGL